jgi:MFS transporter, UMF1 family
MKISFLQNSLKPGVTQREVFSWALYDFANSGYTTVVLTAVFAAYFVGTVAGGASWATLVWTLGLSASHLIVMVTIPFLGIWADRQSGKKRLLWVSTVGCVLATLLLATVAPQAIYWGLFLIIVSNVFFSWGESLIAAFLPELAKPEAMGRVSGWGWSFGYIGGMFTLGLCLYYVLSAQAQGVPATDFVPITMVITAIVFALAATVSLLGLHEKKSANASTITESFESDTSRQVDKQQKINVFKKLLQTWRKAQEFPDFVRFMWCTVAYQGGVAVAITLAAVYAEQEIGFLPQETMVLIFVLNIAAAFGAWVLGYAQDTFGHKRALGLTLVGWVMTCVVAALATNKEVFWWAAVLAGLCMGSSQSIGRAMSGLLSPFNNRAQYYALWSFATRLASIVGPITYGFITWATGGNQRWALVSTSLLFILGLYLLRRVNFKQGVVQASNKPNSK